MSNTPVSDDPRARVLLANANTMLALGTTSVVINRCRECSTPAIGADFGDLLVCGHCGADEQVFTEASP